MVGAVLFIVSASEAFQVFLHLAVIMFTVVWVCIFSVQRAHNFAALKLSQQTGSNIHYSVTFLALTVNVLHIYGS